ncbi:MAG: neutral/alkaline non-lysosomal ceramidase N-terminal domain-containing protein, partial [Verrucomicrobiae bacterium]|nr:neutral/alkaline non-lysosomal ceramidase N-terminal domain-containing protein [Verrucomicrobiae bacterium]
MLGATVMAGDSTILNIGLARADITPGQPVTMAGYASRKDLSQGVHDPLSARAIAFEHGSERLVVVSTDLIGFYDGTCEPIRDAILSECGLRPEQLFLSAVHTHAGPSLGLSSGRAHPNNVAYTKRLKRQLVQVTKTALAELQPANLTAARGSSPVGVNRREQITTRDGGTEIRLGRNPSGPMDREVQVLVVRRPDDAAPRGILFGYSTHSTALGPRNHVISGDVHGLAEQFVERYFGEGTIAPGFAG